MSYIMIVDDDDDFSFATATVLEEAGYEVRVESNIPGAESSLKSKQPDLLILDAMFPENSSAGFELARKIRQSEDPLKHVPILMLTALGTTEDKLSGFEAGADDYIIKPFDFRELLVRIRALLKRIHNTTATGLQLTAGDLIMNLDTKEVTRENIPIQLTAKEFQLLEYFLRNQNSILSRADIALNVWDIDFDSGTNVIDVYVNYLRKKIDKNFGTPLIHTQVGMGYVLKDKNQ